MHIPHKSRLIRILPLVVFAVLLIATMWAIHAYTTRPRTPELPQPALKELGAKKQVALGNFAMSSYLKEKPFTNILTSQFDFALADNTPNWYFTDGGLRPSPTTYNFKQMDQVVKFAADHKMPVQAHHYVWGEEKWLPKWLKEGNYTKEQLMSILHDHIMTVGRHYQGRVAEWTVVNEAFTRGEHYYGLHDWWADHISSDQSYIDQSFIWARQADPKSKLILNDFNNEAINTTSDNMYSYIKGALARGVPIDGIGMQMHIDGTHPPVKDEVKTNMKRFADLGIGVYVTEFDVNMNDVKADGAQKDQIEGDIYYEMMRACVETKGCNSFAYLGITDKETWYNYFGLKDPRPLMFDKDYQPKPAFWRTRDALRQN